MRIPKKYTIGGKKYTIPQIMKLKKMSYTSVKIRINDGVESLDEIKSRNTRNTKKVAKNTKSKIGKPNWKNSMMKDKLGHWALINKALQPHNK